jgi:hypothetical protein
MSLTDEAAILEDQLDDLLQSFELDTECVIAEADIPAAVAHFAKVRDIVSSFARKVSALQKHVDKLAYEQLVTMLTNQNVKHIKIDGVGRAQINVRWHASMPDKEAGMEWLRSTGNVGLIIETVSALTLAAFAKEQALAGKPLPEEVFKVSTAPYVSITKE